MYGLTLNHLWKTRVRMDFRYSRFASSFGSGSYESLSFSRQWFEALQLDVQMGLQNIESQLTSQNRARWINTTVDWFFRAHYFLGSGFTIYSGNTQNYAQWYLNLGYRF